MGKNAQVANCNIVFGEEELPMLEYFDTVVYPAFVSGTKKVGDEKEYMFKNVVVSENVKQQYIISGKIVKKTTLEIKSDINENDELIEKDDKYSAAPYSTFAINLLNHRMLFIPNQKGSPTLANFQSLLKYVLRTHIAKKNSELKEEDKIPYPTVNIVGIPSEKNISSLLENVEKINSLTLRFYPLNGDIDFSNVFGYMSTEMRRAIGSKKGEVIYRSPKDIDGVKEVIEKSGGQ